MSGDERCFKIRAKLAIGACYCIQHYHSKELASRSFGHNFNLNFSGLFPKVNKDIYMPFISLPSQPLRLTSLEL